MSPLRSTDAISRDDRGHTASRSAMTMRRTGAQISEEFVLAPWRRRIRQARQRESAPTPAERAGDREGAAALGPQRVARRATGAALAQAVDEMPATVPVIGACLIRCDRVRPIEFADTRTARGCWLRSPRRISSVSPTLPAKPRGQAFPRLAPARALAPVFQACLRLRYEAPKHARAG